MSQDRRVTHMSIVTACIRPSGASYRDALLSRKPHRNPSEIIDELLKDNLGYLIYQEDTIKFLQQICGLSGSEADNIRRAIGRKQKDRLDAAMPSILEGYCEKSPQPRAVAESEAKEFLQIIEDSASYQFGYNHSIAYCLLGYLCAYYRYYHPLEFITSFLNNAANEDDIRNGTAYAHKIGIQVTMPKWGLSKSEYFFDSEKKVIAKGLSSIKYMSSGLAEEMFEMAHRKKHRSFMDLLCDLNTNSSLKTNQLDILIKIDFFSEFGNQRELLKITELFYDMFKKGQAKQIKKERVDGTPLESIVKKYAVGVTKSGGIAKSYTLLDVMSIMHEAEDAVKELHMDDLSIVVKVRNFAEVMGYVGYVSGREEDRKKLYVSDVYELVRRKDNKQFGYSIITKSIGTASEALSISLAEKAKVDMPFMAKLTGKTEEELEQELSGVVFRLPESDTENPKYVSEDEYLSGNVREKLKVAELAAQADVRYQVNVTALQKVQPKDLSASEINIRLGATWLPESDVEDFMFQLLNTPNYMQWKIKVHFSKYTGEWQVEGRSLDKGNVKANNTYGTTRVSAYRIIEDTLNLRDVRIYDYVEDDDGKKKAVLNKKETAIAQGKQDLIKQAFQDWIWKEPERRQRLTDYYNENFNAIRPREYDGSHLNFYGMNPEIRLREHQKNGVARILYGGNTLLAYVVGAGKTYTMVAAAMESKRLGLCHKSMIVVPNHIIEQFAAEWLQLYPAANLLVATKKDFETKNRKRFCARIATSDVDAVIIGHSQFEKIPLSIERQQKTIRSQIEELVQGITEEKARNGNKFTIKQLEKTKKSLLVRLEKLNDQSKKDQVINFEELGIDRLFVDEADGYKNLYLYTKMRNVAGIAQTEALKSSDMFMKCQYLDELTGGKGVVFATGTPVSNSMVELYTMQRYLQHHTLVEHNLQHFDAWASTFGETVTAIELAPEGTGYRLKTRFAKFYNLRELMQMFREVADIQTADMLNLPVPEVEYRVVSVKPSEMQRDMVAELGERAERVRDGMVNATEDNMLLITNDGRKLALDQRMMNELLPDYPESKVNACVEEVYNFWEQGQEKGLTQLVFCDLSTPKTDGSFSVYNDVRDKLIAKGIPPEEIAFIHDANTEVRKKELFSKVRRGAVRILMSSTFKMGAGTNVQDLIIASHDLDCPWRPRDLEQRAGRTVRQGNKNPKVDIVRYVTEGTFDAYLYQIIENKQKFISQIMTSKSPARSVEDIDEVALSYAEIKALAVGNPYIKEKMDLDIQVSKLQLLKQSFLSQKYEMEDKAVRYFPNEIKQCEQRIADYESDIALAKENTPPDRETFPAMQIHDVVYTEKKEAGQAIIEACKAMKSAEAVLLGRYRGFPMKLSYDSFQKVFIISMYGKQVYHVPLGSDIHGNITRLDNKIQELPDKMLRWQDELENLKVQLENAKEEAQKEFPQEEELAEKVARLGELNVLLDMDKKDQVLLDDGEGVEIEPEQKKKERER